MNALWDVWYECTGGLYAIKSTDEVVSDLVSGEHRITQIHQRPMPPSKGPLGGECTCNGVHTDVS